MLLIGPFAQAEAQYPQSRLVQQEIESMRQAIQTAPAPAAPTAFTGDPSTAPPTGTQPVNPPQPSGAGVSPGKAYDAAFNDYTSGQYDLAIQGFEFYIREFPTSPRAADARSDGPSARCQGHAPARPR